MLHREFGEHHYGRVDLTLRDGQKEKAIARFSDAKFAEAARLADRSSRGLDGVKVYLGEIGWVMVRASGTERMLRVYSETTRPETTQRVLAEVTALVQKL